LFRGSNEGLGLDFVKIEMILVVTIASVGGGLDPKV